MYVDILKETIKNKIRSVLDIPVVDTIIEEKDYLTEVNEYPKLLISEIVDSKTIRVINYDKYDKMGIEEIPILNDIVGLYVCNATTKYLIESYDNGIMVLEGESMDSMVEYIDELTIESNDSDGGKLKKDMDYIYVTSLHNFNRKLNYSVSEVYRRFEIGVFCYNDPDESKCNNYMEILRDVFDSDFELLNTKDFAYIFNPIKFDIENNGKINRVVYGSIMIKTYKTK